MSIMAKLTDTAGSGEAVTTSEVSKKGSNKTVIIVIAIAVVGLLCLCSIIAGALLIVPQLNKENKISDILVPKMSLDTNFSSYMGEYITYTEELDVYLDEGDIECDNSDEYDDIMAKDYFPDQILPLYTQIPTLLNDENDCYNKYRNYEIDKDKEFASKLKGYNCSTSTDAENCKEFKDLLDELIDISEQYVGLRKKIVADQITLDLCYVASLEDNFGNEAAKKTADDLCYESAKDFTEREDALLNRKSEIIDLLDEIALSY